MFCVIWYHLYNFKNVKNNHGRVLLLVKLWYQIGWSVSYFVTPYKLKMLNRLFKQIYIYFFKKQHKKYHSWYQKLRSSQKEWDREPWDFLENVIAVMSKKIKLQVSIMFHSNREVCHFREQFNINMKKMLDSGKVKTSFKRESNTGQTYTVVWNSKNKKNTCIYW